MFVSYINRPKFSHLWNISILILVIFAMSVALVACSSSEEEASPSQPAPAVPAPAPTAAAPAPTAAPAPAQPAPEQAMETSDSLTVVMKSTGTPVFRNGKLPWPSSTFLFGYGIAERLGTVDEDYKPTQPRAFAKS